MKLELIRQEFTDISTIGELIIEGEHFCYTLEDPVRDEKIDGMTAIPCATYEVEVTYSPRFKKNMPLLKNVENFEGIRIHSGNTASDTEGCILVGFTKCTDFIGFSTRAFRALMNKIRGQQLTLEVKEMKNIIVTIFMLFVFMVSGCTGINTSTAVNVASDLAFVAVLQQNPGYKPVVLVALNETKALLQGSLTYDDLLLAISSKFAGKYAIYGVILAGYLSEDKPVFETYLPMLDSYKAAVLKKIDRFILLASM